MIDNRLSKIKNHEVDDSLSTLTDTDILLNFQQAITSLYPHLIPIHAHAYTFVTSTSYCLTPSSMANWIFVMSPPSVF
ncbi:hypothetical protein ACQKME_24910, partial [Priestia megaterium]